MKRIIAICLIALLSLGNLAFGAEIQDERLLCEMFEYKLVPQKLKDVDALMELFFGEDIDQLQKISDTTYQSADLSYVFIYDPQTGYFEMKRPSDIPRYYRIPDDPLTFQNPYPSDEEGRYTPEEAAQLGETFLREGLGMDTSHLIVAEIEAAETNHKARSRMYNIVYQYRLDERKVLTWPVTMYIRMWVSDNGVEGVDTGKAVAFERLAAHDMEKLLDEDALRKQLGGWLQSEDFELCYQPVRDGDEEKLIPAWSWAADVNQALSFNAFTGEEIEFF